MTFRLMSTASAVACVLAALSPGCAPNQGERSDVTMSTTSRVSDAQRAEPRGGASGGRRHVDVMVRDASDANLADSLIGRPVRVQLRRDALGVVGNAPIPTTGRWSAQAAVEGTVLELTDQWLLLSGGGRRHYIPHHAILVIETAE